MDKNEALDIMNSDFKLWERAATEDHGGGKLTKTLTLPWGIGEVSVTLEGMTDAGKRRNAVSGYGEYIRGLIDEATNDEAVTARAKAAAARIESADSKDSNGIGGGPRVHIEPPVQEKPDEEAEQAYKVDVEDSGRFRETLVAKRSEIQNELNQLERRNRQLRTELLGVNAALDAMGEPEDPKDQKGEAYGNE